MDSDRSAVPERPWSLDAERVVERLGVDPDGGLSEQEVERRRARHGRNELRRVEGPSALEIFVRQFRSLIVALLGAAAGVSLIFGEWLEAAAIAAVLGINALLGFFSELRAVRSMEALRELGAVFSRVRREGSERKVDAADLVPGDIVLFEGGDVVTADLRLLTASKLQVDESILTGESLPVDKSVEPVAGDTPTAERTSQLHRGTAVTRGSATGVVVATGMETELGRIAELAQEAGDEVTPLERRLHTLGRRLVWVTLGIAALTIGIGLAAGKSLLLMVQTGIALAVAAVPEGLPIVATIALARGMWRLARRDALVKHLAAVETLGATTLILTDKTGTLTENRLEVERIVNDDEAVLERAWRVAILCNNARLEADEKQKALGDPLEVALLRGARERDFDIEGLRERFPVEREEAFDAESRMMATFHRDENGGCRVAVKGAPEAVLEACTTQGAGESGSEALDDSDRERWLERNAELGADGMRVLALAERRGAALDEEPYRELVLLGLVAMADPPRDEVREPLAICRRAGIRVVMLTGDQPTAAAAIARDVGLVDGEVEVIVGRELGDPDSLDPDHRRRLLAASVFARVDPAQKLQLLRLHREAGEIIGMTGDGVNDAPALKRADIGIAMGRRGTQVAQEAADVVLIDDAFASIVAAVRQGRVIFSNIRKFVIYLMSCNVSEIMIVAGAVAVNAPLPLLPLQILFLNLVTDVFPALALAMGEGSASVMERPPRDPSEPVLAGRHWRSIVGIALAITAAVLSALAVALLVLELDVRAAVTVSFVTLALAQLWNVFSVRDVGSGWWNNDIVRNRWVWSALALCVVLILAAVLVPGISTVLQTTDPGAAGWLLALGASLVPAVIVQGVRTIRGR